MDNWCHACGKELEVKDIDENVLKTNHCKECYEEESYGRI